MIDIIPIIITYLLLILIVISIFFIIAKIKIKKLGYWMLGGYMFVLLVTLIIYLFIPVEEMTAENELSSEEMGVDMMHKVAYRGLAIEEFERYKINEWEFDMDSQESIRLDVDGEYTFPVVIEEVSDVTHISAALYHVDSLVELEPISYGIEAVQLRLVNKELKIELPGPGYYHYAQLTKEFPFTQFNDSEEADYLSPAIYTGEYLLYLKVPEHLELIVNPNINYEYLD